MAYLVGAAPVVPEVPERTEVVDVVAVVKVVVRALVRERDQHERVEREVVSAVHVLYVCENEQARVDEVMMIQTYSRDYFVNYTEQ